MDDDYEDDSLDEFSEVAAETFLSMFGAMPRAKNRRFRPIDAVVLGLFAAHGYAEATANVLATAYNQLASHANLGRDLEDMQEDATREIESLISGDENG